MLGTLTVKGTFDSDEQQAKKLDKLYVARWIVHANCLKKIIDNCKPLLELWKKKLGRNVRCKNDDWLQEADGVLQILFSDFN